MSSLKACLRYLRPGIERPIYIASQGGAGAAMNIQAEFDDRPVVIKDARKLQTPPTLDRQGFCLRILSPANVAQKIALEN
jgi:hypothetical protein